MSAALQIHNRPPANYSENISQPKLLLYNTMPELHEEKIRMRMATKPLPVFSSLGLLIPFQPSMWDEKSIEAAWQHALQTVQEKINGRHSAVCTEKIMTRLRNLFGKLNFNTHRKSLAVILTPDEEKLIYLSYPVKPVVFSGKSVSLLDLAATIQQEAAFYYFFLTDNSASLYNYNNKELHKVYEQNNETCLADLFKNASNTIELLNGSYETPVFVTGRPNLVEGFCNSSTYAKHFFTVLHHASPFNRQNIQSLVKEISQHWDYWQAKFTARRVLLAQKANALVSNFDAVLQALQKNTDGLLLIDKYLKRRLQKPNATGTAFFKYVNELNHQIETFSGRGNQFEITKTGLLKDLGGIVLLQRKRTCTAAFNPHARSAGAAGCLF